MLKCLLIILAGFYILNFKKINSSFKKIRNLKKPKKSKEDNQPITPKIGNFTIDEWRLIVNKRKK